MKDSLLDYKSLHQQTIIGQLKLTLHPKEFTLLKLRYAPKQELMKLWSELWKDIQDYDDLPAGCRTLMPSVVSRIQRMGIDENWKRVHGLDLTFLVGLPRYVWTKNKYLLNQTLRIAEHVGRSGIEIVAIKGMAELLSDAEMGTMRSTFDLDLLIRPEDFDIFTQKMSEIGYRQIDTNKGILEKRSPLPKDQFLFMAENGSKLQVDVHLMVDKYKADDRLTELVWLGKVPSKHCATLFVPSPRDRFLISLVNGFRITNWYSGSYLKYLSDALSEFNIMHQDENQNDHRIGFESLNIQDWHKQILQIGREIALFDEQIMENHGLNQIQESGAVLSSPGVRSISLKESIFRKLTGSLSSEKKLNLFILLNLYSQVWQSRGKQGFSGKAIKFLLLDPLLQIVSVMGRRAQKLWKHKNPGP